jgi:tetratricopeptide (TPR) repeat protein
MPEASLESYDAGLAAAQRDNDLQGQITAQVGRVRALTVLGRLDGAAQALAAANALLKGQESALARELGGAQLAEINLLRTKGQFSEARSRIEPMIEQVRQTSDKRHAILPAALMMATRVYIGDRRFEDAARTATEALTLYTKRAREPQKSADVGEALLWLATAQRGLGESDRSYETAARAARALQSGLGSQHPLTQEAVRLSSSQPSTPVAIHQ